MSPRRIIASLVIGLLALSGWLASSALAQRAPQTYTSVSETRSALAKAQADQLAAAARAEKLERTAKTAKAAASRTQQEAAALAARIQQAEAGISAAKARIAIADRERAMLDKQLSERREPLVRLTGALQKMSLRPLVFAVLKPGSLRDTVYLRAVLETTIPEVRKRTAALRGEIARRERIAAEAGQALAALKANQSTLDTRRKQLAALESRQRLASRKASGDAAREAERALALSETARDLDALVSQLGEAGALRQQLAALPGPIMRPSESGAAPLVEPSEAADTTSAVPRAMQFQLPVIGRTVTGFGEEGADGLRANGISLSPVDGAQVVAPAAGRVAFAGPYRGFDRIVIIESDGGFTSLVTGLARVDVSVGDQLVGGAPLGVAGAGHPVVTFELRKDGTPVNPLAYLR